MSGSEEDCMMQHYYQILRIIRVRCCKNIAANFVFIVQYVRMDAPKAVHNNFQHVLSLWFRDTT